MTLLPLREALAQPLALRSRAARETHRAVADDKPRLRADNSNDGAPAAAQDCSRIPAVSIF